MFIGFLSIPIIVIVACLPIVGINIPLTSHPETFLLYHFLFGFPHILASILILLDKAYLKEFRRYIIAGLCVCTLTFLSMQNTLFREILIVLIPVAALTHVLGQQFGIGFSLVKNRSRLLVATKWITILTSLAIQYQNMHMLSPWLIFASWIVITNGIIFYVIRKTGAPSAGINYMILSQLTLSVALCFLTMNYVLLSVLCITFTHDVTALRIYGEHNRRRNEEVSNNPIFGSKLIPRYYIAIWTFILCYAVNFGRLEFIPLGGTHLDVILCVGLFHYIVEHFIWRSKHTPNQYVKGLYQLENLKSEQRRWSLT